MTKMENNCLFYLISVIIQPPRKINKQHSYKHTDVHFVLMVSFRCNYLILRQLSGNFKIINYSSNLSIQPSMSLYKFLINNDKFFMYTFSCPGTDLGRRSASISYFRILKHSSRSSKKCPYVRTQAEQSQARKKYLQKKKPYN